MAAPLAEELGRLLNPLPRAELDPEDDPEEATRAKVIERFDEGDLDDGIHSVGTIRKGVASSLLDAEKRYHGKATTRKALQEELWGTTQLPDEETSDQESDESDFDCESLEEEGSPETMEEEEASNSEEERKLPSSVKNEGFSFQPVDDFEKFAEGMDEIGSEEEDATTGDDSESERESEESGKESEAGMAGVNESPDGGMLLSYSKEKVAEEVTKGRAVKNQIALWDHLLESRIKLQKALVTANQLPQPDTFSEFKKRGGQELSNVLKNNYKALKALLRTLVDLQDELLHQYSGTRHLVAGELKKEDSDQEIQSSSEDQEEKRMTLRPPKRKLKMEDYPEFAAKRFAEIRVYQNSTLQKWHDKTKLASGKVNKGFGAFERSILTQIDHILMDKERLLRRTQTKRSAYRILGKPQAAPEPPLETGQGQTEALPPVTLNAHLKDLDKEIFDDDDFYHQLLRELIERKTSSLDQNDQVAMGRQWLAIQKLRSKIKKKVDTKASKGRKIRYHVHSKLVSFMAPIDHCRMNDDASQQRRSPKTSCCRGKQRVQVTPCFDGFLPSSFE